MSETGDLPLTVVILAAGLGTRMKSRHAKVLHSAGGRTLIEHTVATALELAPPERIFVVVGHQSDRVRDKVAALGVRFVEQREQKGTGHALIVGRESLSALGGRLLVFYGDCPLITPATLDKLVAAQRNTGSAVAMLTAELPDPTGYGRVIRDAGGRVTGIVEQRAATTGQRAVKECNMGYYCFRSDVFWKHIDEMQPNNPAREYYLTDMIEILIRAGHAVEATQVDNPGELLGINNRVELAEADRLIRERKGRELMLEGVTIERPETVMIDVQASIGADTVIEPFAQVLGASSIGEGCRVGACSIIRDSELADEATVHPFSHITGSRLERGAEAGPYARLRAGSHLEPAAHAGNFVELKKTRLGRGSKAMHLAYLGDTTIGDKVNVGAGTITCNYDGEQKHPTHIQDGVFVGSNSTLIAPLDIGERAYIAAGSVITEQVPPETLAIGRSRQVLKPGWRPKRRDRRPRPAGTETGQPF
jgi:bifunctional UDP-N-acetylglucosamine pyrophosphorylase/glucosamine-1-phosphate N-acetyltransferase